ncbi:MAG: 4-phosphoerythronate dehydrogenase [Muribaculaceae bacterium]|nr:4-phosphoerythronate dehydrogenase [Muribaculaceae bacterium]
MPNPFLNIIVEANVPYLRGVLEQYASNVRYLPSEEITPKAVENCDALIVRTRTRCDEALLGRSRCRLVATATIGTDHIDTEWCASRGIVVVNAPGCNAPAVAQYVFASLMRVICKPIGAHTIGIIGVGHVGSIVERWARALDMRVLRYDPPRQAAEGGDDWATLDEIAAEADIITFHTPLTREGEHATYHMADEAFFGKLRRAPILINSARGAIVDTPALVQALDKGLVGSAIIDCWENEPEISRELLERAAIATPHIAGYSAAGKVRASQEVADAVTTMFYLPRVHLNEPQPPACARAVTATGVAESYDPEADTAALRANPENFELLRNNYPLRREAPEGKID